MDISKLHDKANEIRQDVIKMLVAAGSGHSAGSLGMADVFAALYFGGQLVLDPADPWREDRDRILVSSGHICPVWYAALAHAGYFPREELGSLRQINSRLQGHPHVRSLPGIENTSGPLGQGMSVAVGVALALRLKRPTLPRIPRVICITSDAELQEGQAWEAAMAASKYQLDNLTFITDRNYIQIDGFTEDIMPLEPLALKLGSFGFHVLSVDGHNIQEVLNALQFDLAIRRQPVWIIANTIPGKGVSFMEGMYEWHGKPPTKKGEAVGALAELKRLRTLGGRVTN